MSEEIWKHYQPIEGLEENYNLIGVDDSPKGLKLLFSSQDKDSKGVEVVFDRFYESYRCTEEGGRYRTLCDLIKRYGRGYMASSIFYLVENSRYVDWLVYESHDALEKKDLLHFAFLSTGVYVDVIAVHHPKIVFMNIPQDGGDNLLDK